LLFDGQGKCKVPFTLGTSTESYFCVKSESDAGKRQCLTDSGVVENCSDGKFLIFKHSSLPDFTLTFMFRKKFDLLPDKEYTIRFSYFFEDCSQSGEKLNMEIFVVGPTQEQNDVYTSDDRVIGGNVAKWSQQVVCFQVGKADSYSVKSNFFFIQF